MEMYIEIGQYLNKRLIEMGIHHIFGVAGDFNLSYLEQIIEDESLTFIGNCNELNAAYAADGYARSNGFSALVTTYGVGDLSAINGIAGAYAENVPIVHISGIPPLHSVNQRKLMHHTLIDGNYDNIMNCMREFTVAQTRLTPENAALEIDRVLALCFLQRRPVHIQLPSDITHVKIKTPIAPLSLQYPAGDLDILKMAVQKLCEIISKSNNPVFLVDNEAHIYGVTELIEKLAITHHIPYVSLQTSKNIMNESITAFSGVYVGEGSMPNVKALVEGSDCLIGIGVRFTDAATGFFTHDINPHNFIAIKQYDLSILNENFPGLEIKSLLTTLNEKLSRKEAVSIKPVETPEQMVKTSNDTSASHGPLTHVVLWNKIAAFLQDGDVIIGEVGTSNAGLSSVLLPADSSYISQPLWGSIGYTLPALLGSIFAAPDRRHVLFIGDGSLQLTVQELSTIVRHELKPIIFVLNNGGYTIERLILGEHSLYNDIQDWKYTDIVPVFNGKGNYQSFKVETVEGLESTLNAIGDNDALTVVELMLDPMDAPESLKKFGVAVARYDYGETTYRSLMHK